MRFLYLRRPVGYEYLVEDEIDRPACPECGSTDLMIWSNGDIYCRECECRFEFLEDPISRMADGLVYYDQGQKCEDLGEFLAANRYYTHALESFGQALNKKKEESEEDLWLLCALIYQFKIEHDFDLERLNHLENYLKAIEEFVRLHGEDKEACFLEARAYQLYADHQDYRAIRFYEKAKQKMEQAIELAEKEGEVQDEYERGWQDFAQSYLQQIWRSLARAYEKAARQAQDNESEQAEYKEKARKLYMKLADVIEKGIVFPEKDEKNQTIYQKPSLDPILFSLYYDLEEALDEAGQRERLSILYPKLLDLSEAALMAEKRAAIVHHAAQCHLQAADYFEQMGNSHEQLSALLRLHLLYQNGVFDGFDFIDSHILLPFVLMLNNHLADYYERAGDLSKAQDYLQTNIDYLCSLQSEYLINDGFFEEEDRYFYQLEAQRSLACFYQRQNRIALALLAWQQFFEDYEQFVDLHAGSIHLDMHGYAPDDNLLEEMLTHLQALKNQGLESELLDRLLEEGKALFLELFS